MKKVVYFAAFIAVIALSACKNKSAQKVAEEPLQSVEQTEPAAVVVEEIVSPFVYEAPLPKNGKLKGVVELGATGFNSFVINLDSEKNWKLEKAEFGASGVVEGNTSADEVKARLKTYIKSIINSGVSGKNIHFVVSSSARDEPLVKTIIAALKSLGYVVNAVTPEKEGAYALKSVLPKEYESKAFVVDLGSGNTKISWITGGKVETLDTYGAKYAQNGVEATAVYQSVSDVVKNVSAANRKVCFIIGGVPFKMAKALRDGKERYTALKSEKAFVGGEDFQEAREQGGLNIYKAIRETTGCKTFVFDWDANFSIGFLLSIPY